jgi:membrane protein DedA with SNARE-associated domain
LRRAFRFASHELDERGGVVIVVARYIPVGRVAVNVTAGASEFPRPRFLGFTAIAAVTWAAYSVAIGALAGTWVEQNPLLGAVGGIAVAVLLGVASDNVVRRRIARRPALVEREEAPSPLPVECAECAPRA